jgi:hypothetical protein
MWFERDIRRILEESRDAIQVLRGPRQCGKSSLLLRMDDRFREVSLDDPGLRDYAQRDPELFLRSFGDDDLLIDEAQYAPALFPSLKRRADLFKRKGGPPRTILRLTGSNQILMDHSVKESLAGRASYFDLNTLSVAEVLAGRDSAIQDILFCGGWPELHATAKHPHRYLDDYINTYVEKDVVLAAGIQKAREFLRFVQLLAGRTGQLLDMASFGRDCAVDNKTIKEWLSVLERMALIYLVPPFASNLSTRLIKSPKAYFCDTGLACRLQGWTSAQPILTSPQQGHLFENLVVAELARTNQNFGLGLQIFHWRSRDREEVDFVVQVSPTRWLMIEAKVTAQDPPRASDLPEARKVFGRVPRIILCHQEGSGVRGDRVPIANLQSFLLDFVRGHA